MGIWFHSVDDRKRAITQISAGLNDLIAELVKWHQGPIDPLQAPATAQWLTRTVMPTIAEWNHFVHQEYTSWIQRAATRWQTYQGWHQRLKSLRELARAHGIVLESPEPAPLPHTIWEIGESGAGDEGAAWLGVGKHALGTVMTFTGVIALYTVVRDYRRLRMAELHGLSAGKTASDFNPAQLAIGTAVEMEHTGDRKIAQRIAMDHLTEDPRYYQKLATIEPSKKG